MEAADFTVGSFGEQHFGRAQFGNRRRTQRLVQLANEMVHHPGGSFPDKLNRPADLKAFYRLMNQEKVTHATVLAPHRERTVELMRQQEETVLLLHDTTEFDYSGLESVADDLGQIGEGHGRGYKCHNSLAVVAKTREVLGLANQILFCRPQVPKGETKKQRQQRPNRESRLWKRGVEGLPLAPAGRRWVDVCDRGADITEFLDFEVRRGREFVVRSQHNRRITAVIAGKTKRTKLHDWARRLPQAGRRPQEVQARAGQPARTAQLAIAWSPFHLVPPRQARGEHGQQPLSLWVVRVWEVEPPPGVQPLEWILLTNVAVSNLADAWERVDWYQLRWIIEEYHKALKTGCAIEEMQFTSVARLQPAIALISVVALCLLWLRNVSRQPDAQTRKATERFSADYVRALSLWRWRKCRQDLSVHEFCYAMARLGGHQNRRHDHPPGWLVLWRGWTKLQLLVEGAATTPIKRSG